MKNRPRRTRYATLEAAIWNRNKKREQRMSLPLNPPFGPATQPEIADAKRELQAAQRAQRADTERAATISIFLSEERVHTRRFLAAVKKAFHMSSWAVVVVAPKLSAERFDNIVTVRDIDESQLLARSVMSINCADPTLIRKTLLMGVSQIILTRAVTGSEGELPDTELPSQEYANKVDEIGAGITLPVEKELNPDSLRALVDSVLNDECYTEAARAASKQLLAPKKKTPKKSAPTAKAKKTPKKKPLKKEDK